MVDRGMFHRAAFALLALLGTAGAAGSPVYVGAQKCKMCHLKEYSAWAASRMAKSFELLAPGVAGELKAARGFDPKKDYRADPRCLSCHTTGYGKPGGFVDVVKTPNLTGVQCEVCHGPGGTYTQKRFMSLQNREYKRADLVQAGLTAEITKATCVTCHNSVNPFAPQGDEFDFDARMRQGVHPITPLKYQH